MGMNEKTPFIVSGICSTLMLAWMVVRGDDPLKAVGAALMIGSAMFLFVGFFTRPKYQFGEFSILQNAYRINEKLNELDAMPHHKQIYGKRMREGTEEIPSPARLRSMLKPELVQVCIGLGLPSDPDLHTKKQLIENIIEYKEAGVKSK